MPTMKDIAINGRDVAERLTAFAYIRFGSINALANSLDMQPSSLRSNYLSGRSIPGGNFLAKLALLGCDLHWLLIGVPIPLAQIRIRSAQESRNRFSDGMRKLFDIESDASDFFSAGLSSANLADGNSEASDGDSSANLADALNCK